MEQTPATPWIQRTGTHGTAVEQHLTALRQANRLAIHMVETPNDAPTYHVHSKTLDHLNAIPADMIDAHLKAGKKSLFSMSLLPNNNTVGLCPYMVREGTPTNYGYLFDLSQTQPHPPKVVRAHPYGLVSGPDRRQKNLQLTYSSLNNAPEALRTFYMHYLLKDNDREGRELLKDIGGQNGSALTEQQLDLLAAEYNKPDDERFQALPMLRLEIADYNEILVAASPQHISAITVPYYEQRLDPQERSWYLAQQRLQAALVGLDHLAQGINLPVVMYSVNRKPGHITFIGQTREELTQVALTSLQLLGERGQIYFESYSDGDSYYDMLRAVEAHLGVDLTEPAAKWEQAVADKLAAPSKAAPSPPR